jgi:hypothetical protein
MSIHDIDVRSFMGRSQTTPMDLSPPGTGLVYRERDPVTGKLLTDEEQLRRIKEEEEAAADEPTQKDINLYRKRVEALGNAVLAGKYSGDLKQSAQLAAVKAVAAGLPDSEYARILRERGGFTKGFLRGKLPDDWVPPSITKRAADTQRAAEERLEARQDREYRLPHVLRERRRAQEAREAQEGQEAQEMVWNSEEFKDAVIRADNAGIYVDEYEDNQKVELFRLLSDDVLDEARRLGLPLPESNVDVDLNIRIYITRRIFPIDYQEERPYAGVGIQSASFTMAMEESIVTEAQMVALEAAIGHVSILATKFNLFPTAHQRRVEISHYLIREGLVTAEQLADDPEYDKRIEQLRLDSEKRHGRRFDRDDPGNAPQLFDAFFAEAKRQEVPLAYTDWKEAQLAPYSPAQKAAHDQWDTDPEQAFRDYLYRMGVEVDDLDPDIFADRLKKAQGVYQDTLNRTNSVEEATRFAVHSLEISSLDIQRDSASAIAARLSEAPYPNSFSSADEFDKWVKRALFDAGVPEPDALSGDSNTAYTQLLAEVKSRLIQEWRNLREQSYSGADMDDYMGARLKEYAQGFEPIRQDYEKRIGDNALLGKLQTEGARIKFLAEYAGLYNIYLTPENANTILRELTDAVTAMDMDEIHRIRRQITEDPTIREQGDKAEAASEKKREWADQAEAATNRQSVIDKLSKGEDITEEDREWLGDDPAKYFLLPVGAQARMRESKYPSGIFADQFRQAGAESPAFLEFLFGKQGELEQEYTRLATLAEAEQLAQIGQGLPPSTSASVGPPELFPGQFAPTLPYTDQPEQVYDKRFHMGDAQLRKPQEASFIGNNGFLSDLDREWESHKKQYFTPRDKIYLAKEIQKGRRRAGRLGDPLTPQSFFGTQAAALREEYQRTPGAVRADVQEATQRKLAAAASRRLRKKPAIRRVAV